MSIAKFSVSDEGMAIARSGLFCFGDNSSSRIYPARKYSCREVWAKENSFSCSRIIKVAVRRSFCRVSRSLLL